MHAHAARCTLIGLAIVAGLAACSKSPPRHAAVPPGAVVLALGDSLTYGTGATPATSYPAVLSTITGWNVVNAGVPGETAAEGCARLPDLVDEHKPALVLVLLGGNDFLRRLPDQGVADALHRCVRGARDAGTPVALLTVPRLGGNGLSDAGLYAEVATSEAVPLVDSGLSKHLAQRDLRADFVHLNAEGYRRMAQAIAEGLREAGFAAR